MYLYKGIKGYPDDFRGSFVWMIRESSGNRTTAEKLDGHFPVPIANCMNFSMHDHLYIKDFQPRRHKVNQSQEVPSFERRVSILFLCCLSIWILLRIANMNWTSCPVRSFESRKTLMPFGCREIIVLPFVMSPS